MLSMMPGERVAAESSAAVNVNELLKASPGATPDTNVMATRDGDQVSVLVWNYDDSAESAVPAQTEVTVTGLAQTARYVLLEPFRIDQDHSNTYTVWQSLGSSQDPSPTQIAELKAAGELHLFTSPSSLHSESGSVKLGFHSPGEVCPCCG